MVARDFPNASFAFETIRGIDVRSKYPISLKNLIHLNGVRPLSIDKRKSVDDDENPITPLRITTKVSPLQAYRNGISYNVPNY